MVKHHGDICKINGAEIEPTDIISFGSPCQDLSVAGLRMGMKHEGVGDDETTRSGLFYEAIRIIKEMRENDRSNGRTGQSVRCRYAIYENVPGAFSSNKGADFAAVLTAFVKIVQPEAPDVPIPPDGWRHADALYGMGADGIHFSVAWRLHDAQWWGVPQRRKRLCVLVDFAGLTAPWILFDPQFERVAENGEPYSFVRDLGNDAGQQVQSVSEGVSRNPEPSGEAWEDPAEGTSGSVDSASGSVAFGISPYESNAMKSSNPYSGVYKADTSRTLDMNGGSPACNQGGVAVVSIPVEGNGTRQSHRGDGYGKDGDPSFTLNSVEQHGVAVSVDCRNGTENPDVNGTLQAKPNGGHSYNCNIVIRTEQT